MYLFQFVPKPESTSGRSRKSKPGLGPCQDLRLSGRNSQLVTDPRRHCKVHSTESNRLSLRGDISRRHSIIVGYEYPRSVLRLTDSFPGGPPP